MKNNMKNITPKRTKKFAAAAVSGLLAAAVLITTILSSKLEAEAAETFLGIEELRNEVAESGRTYTILEIVPDRNTAEIGFLSDGYEPVLSVWNEETKQWESWREKLCSFVTFEERKAYIEELKQNLRTYYDTYGIGKVQPVTAAGGEYEESGMPENGFEAITSSTTERTGWFVAATEGSERFQLVFKYKGTKENYDEESGWVYYKISGTPTDISTLSEEERNALPEDTIIYKKETGDGVFSVMGLWSKFIMEDPEKDETEETTTEEESTSEAETETETETEGEVEKESETETETETESETETETETESETETETETESETETETETETEPESSEPESSEPESSEPESSEPESSEPESNAQDDKESEGNDTESSAAEVSAVDTARFVRLSSKTISDSVEEDGTKETDSAEEPAVQDDKETEEASEESEKATEEASEESEEATEEASEESEEATEEEESEGATEEATSEESEEATEEETSEESDETTEETVTEESGETATQETEEETEEATAIEITEDTYYLVSFERITDVEALSDTDTIYIVEEGGIIRSNDGEYSFVESDDENEKKQTYTFAGITIYCKNTFKNNEWFKKNALDMEEADYEKFPIQVLTFTPAELNEMQELPEFDFLYLNSGARVIDESAETAVYEKDTMDLDAKTVQIIFEHVNAEGTPCLVDGNIMYVKDAATGSTNIRSDLKNTQIFRLAALLSQESLEDWEKYSGNFSALPIENLIGTIQDSDKNFSTYQTYCRFGEDSIINSNFAEPTIHKGDGDVEDGFEGVLEEINLENLYRESDKGKDYEKLSTDISQARVLRHIINYKNRRTTETKKHIKVLEIQPALTTEAEISLGQLQEWAPGVESKETTIMTTAEFIGKIEKLNETYDLIYIGTSKEHLNIKRWVEDDSLASYKTNPYMGSTVFNDTDMDGLIYYNIGDLRVTYVAMAGLLDSEYPNNDRTNEWPWYYNYVRYGGNDITEEKMEALLSFLDGSYPIIISDEFMEQPVTFFEEKGYAGRRGTLGVGDYSTNELREHQIYADSDTGNEKSEKISSLKVKEGYKVTLYYDKEKVTFENDVEDLSQVKMSNGSTWDNKCSSVLIEKIETAQQVKAVDEDHIDNCTYLYEFVNKALEEKYTNFYVKGDIDGSGSELLKFYLNRPKAELVNFTANGNKDENNMDNDVYYISSGANGKYTLQYSFKIQNEGAATADTQYNCKLYIDVNADGKFSELEEVSDINITENGSRVSAEELYAGKNYVLSREVPPGYKGLLPWKVEICQVNNENIYASANGYTKLKGLDIEVLKICQIYKDNSSIIDLSKEISTTGTHFNTLLDKITYNGKTYWGIKDEFILDVTAISISKYEELIKENPDYLKNYNMLILGFSDTYGDFSGDSETGAMGAIVDFINSGKSVLLSHDTTSFFNNPIKGGSQKGYPWRDNTSDVREMHTGIRNAATLNTYIRPLVGMDRYGVLEIAALRSGNILQKGDDGWSDVVNSGKDVAYKPKSGKQETVPEVHGYTYALISAKDHKVNSRSKITSFTRYELYEDPYDDSVMPDSWRFTNKYRNIRYDEVFFGDWDTKEDENSYGELYDVDNGEVSNVHATQVNKGQITEYPFKLQEDFEIAQTHSQYYELDYTADDDHDGQSDLVVWYCLGGRTSTNGRGETVYSQSPNDVRNNYYIYNKGNITYTGMGHSAGKNPKYTYEEAKLFINTMIASYQAGVKPPYIGVKENGLKESPEISTMYRFYDEANGISLNDEATVEDYEKIYFTVQDINFVKGSRNIMSHVYYKNNGGNEKITVDGFPITVTKLEDRIYDAATGVQMDCNNLQSGGIYYILVPKTVMAQCDTGLELYFEAQSVITSNVTASYSNVYTTDKTYAKLEVLKAYLFDLD